MKIYGMINENRLFQDKVSMSMKNGYFQEAASANAEAIIFLHDYVMSYLGGILIVVLILIIVLSVLFTGTNDKREFVLNFMPKGSTKRFVAVPFKKGLEKTDVTLLRLSQPKNPLYMGLKFRFAYGAKYKILAKNAIPKRDLGFARLEQLRKLARKNKKYEYETNIKNVAKWLKKGVISFTNNEEGDIRILYSNKYTPRPLLRDNIFFVSPTKRVGIALKAKVWRKWRGLSKGVRLFLFMELRHISGRLKLQFEGLVHLLKNLNKVRKDLEIEEWSLNSILFGSVALEELFFNKNFRKIYLGEEVRWEIKKEVFIKKNEFQSLEHPLYNLLDGTEKMQARALSFKITMFEKKYQSNMQKIMPEIIGKLKIQDEANIFMRRYARLVLSIWKRERADLFDVYTVGERKGGGTLVAPQRDESYSLRVENKCHNLTLELLGTLVPALILLIIGAPSLATLYSLEEVVAPEMTVKVIGNQWFWTYEYQMLAASDIENVNMDMKPGMQGYAAQCKNLEPISFSFESHLINEEELAPGQLRLLEVDFGLLLPINSEIRLLVTSYDVIHSFAVPALGLKTDGIPGRINEVPLFIKRKGLYYGQCSELCGINHAFMPIVVQTSSPRLIYYMLSFVLLD